MMSGMMGWMMAPGWLMGWVLLTGLIVLIIVLVVSTARRSRASAQPLEKPLEILKRRYVQGEIDSDQFEKMKRQLQENG